MAEVHPNRGRRSPSDRRAALGKESEPAPGRQARLIDVFLTVPVFVVYHLGVVFLTVRNGLDPVTDLLLSVLHRSMLAYLGITVCVGGLFVLAARLPGRG